MTKMTNKSENGGKMEGVINPNALAEVKHYLKGISKKDKKEDFIVLFLKWNKLYFTSLQMALNQGLSSLVTFLLH